MMRKTSYALLLLTALTAQGCVSDGQLDTTAALKVVTGAVQTATYSESQIKSESLVRIKAMDQEAKIAPSSNKYAKRLNRLTRKHRNEDGLNLNFKVYLSPQVNAFATPDGSIRFYSGLMDKMTDDELRFVIGHEIGHVKLQHSLKKARLALATQTAMTALASHAKTAAIPRHELAQLGAKMFLQKHSRSEESNSDEYSAMTFLKKHGYNRKAAKSALLVLAEGHNSDLFSELLSSHPNPHKRAAKVEKLVAAN